MNFDSYTKLIKQSVAECGYDEFLPYLCISNGDTEELSVLETELHDDGDKAVALDWASQFMGTCQKLFCAYRIGNRQVEVVEVTGTEVTEKMHIDVQPYALGEWGIG